MRNILLLFFLTGFVSGWAQEPVKIFTLTGTIEGKSEGVIYLNRNAGIIPGTYITDTVNITSGSFVIKGTLNEPSYATLSDGDISNMNNPNMLTIFLEPAKMNISLEWNNFKNYKLTGSATNDDAVRYDQKQRPLIERLKELDKVIREGKDTLKRKAYEGEMTEIRARLEPLPYNFIKSNPDSYYSAFLLNMSKSGYSKEKMESGYNLLSERVKGSGSAKEVLAEINKLKALEPGNSAPVLVATDINGNKLTLSDFRGKYVILDFWASWCIPCRKGNPHLKELYNKYHEKGLEVICIADNDSSPDKWREAVEKDGIGMFHHVLRGLKVLPGYRFDRTNDISEPYAIHFLPTKYLIDREGKIVGKMEGDELDKKLEEIFK
jgi:thiol-disulfide isomerase/thioredoxin